MKTRMMVSLWVGLLMAAGMGVGVAAGQEEPVTGWQTTADLSLNLNQASYSDSWDGEENGSIIWTAKANVTAEKRLSEQFDWRNTLKLAFGQTHNEYIGDDRKRQWESPEKSTDRMFFESLLRMTLGYFADPYAAFTFESQFYKVHTNEADSTQSLNKALDPITLTESVGLGRSILKNEQTELFSRVGFAMRQHLMKNVVDYDPEEVDSESVTDGGLEWVTDFAHTFGGDNLKYVSKLRVFQALFNSEEDEFENDDWKTADLAWENTFSANVAKYIQVSLFAELLYDKEIDERGRFRETLGLGLSYTLF